MRKSLKNSAAKKKMSVDDLASKAETLTIGDGGEGEDFGKGSRGGTDNYAESPPPDESKK